MNCYSEQYKQLQEQFHLQRPDYGTSGARHADFVMATAKKIDTRDILDYACGKAGLQKMIPYPIQNYDPFMPEYAKRPEPADLVVCTDALEHIEPDCVDAVLDDLRDLTKKAAFLVVATRPAAKVLPDGRNAHLIQQNGNWWLEQLMKRFLVISFQASQGEFACIVVPPSTAKGEANEAVGTKEC